MELLKRGTGLKGKLQILQVERKRVMNNDRYALKQCEKWGAKESLKREKRAESGSVFSAVHVKYWEMVIQVIFHFPSMHTYPCQTLFCSTNILCAQPCACLRFCC